MKPSPLTLHRLAHPGPMRAMPEAKPAPPVRPKGDPFSPEEIAARQAAREARQEAEAEAHPHKRYRCPACREIHRTMFGAEECCPREVDVVWQSDEGGEAFSTAQELLTAIAEGRAGSGDIDCPVCASKHKDHQAAADCCLWKDLAFPQRYAIAQKVEQGATWQEAIEQAAQ